MLRVAALLFWALNSQAALTLTAVRTAPAPVPALRSAQLLRSPLSGPNLAAPLPAAPSLLPAAPPLAPAPRAVAPVALLAPAAEALAAPEPARLPAALGKVFDGSAAPAASFAPDFAPPGPVSALGRLSAAGEAAFDRYARGGLGSAPESDDQREAWTKKKLLDYRELMAEISAALPKDAAFIYPFMGPDAVPALLRPTFPIEHDQDDFRRGRDLAEKFLGLDASVLGTNLLTRETFDVRRLEDYAKKVDAIAGPRVFILKDFWRYSQDHPELLGRMADRLLRPGDMVLVLREGDVRLMQGAEALGLSRVGRIRAVQDPGDSLWTEHPLMDFKVLTLPTAFSLWVKGQVAAAPAVSLAKPAVLEPGSWLPENKARLERLIREHGRGSAQYDAKNPPLATFDWDNTMIRNDIGEAVFYRAVRELAFRFEDERFWRLIPEEFGREELRRSYEAVARLPLAQAQGTPEYRRYRKLFHQVYERVKKEGPDLGLDYGWLVQLMVGYSKEEVERFADATLAAELAKPLGSELITDSDSDPAPIRIASGIRPHQEMFDLARRLKEAGWEVRIVSATAEWVVARAAALAGILPEHVHGVRARLRGGRLTTRLTQRTWGQGKADTILRRAGRASLLAGGDSNSDLQMLELSRGERLVVDFGREPLRAQARERGWLLQPPFQL
ncbi:MAG: haloacid dehalogenase-like hydrolase [Elusimicrobia bacterium]|nr:haloacid dehalogenase-like hydrolase [Elusimicrobiota bacterium]